MRKAALFTVAILLALEMTLARTTVESGLRYACFMVLIMIWSALRCDDLQNIDPTSVTLSQLGLKFNLLRTKTSGPGKKQGTLQGFVLRGVSLSGYDWLAAGMTLLQSNEFKFPRDFLCVHLDDTWQVASRDFLEPEGVAALVRAVLRSLHAPKRVDGKWGLSKTVHLVPENLVTFWSGHSPRHVLPSLAAAVGVPEERINFLGRWAVARSASSTYILTSRQVVHQIQAQICRALLEGEPAPGLVEEELFQQMQQRVASKGGDGSQAAVGHQVLSWSTQSSSWFLRSKFPAISVDPAALKQALDTSPTLEVPDGEVADEAPYFVTVSRSGFRRLHVSKACSAWEACQQFAVKEQELKAEARVLGVPRPVTQTDRAAVRASYIAAHGNIEDSLEPSDDYLSAKAEELESHEPTASPLNEVTSKRSARTLGIQTSIDAGGQIRIVRNKQKGSLPQGTEELRTTLRIEANMWCFLALISCWARNAT